MGRSLGTLDAVKVIPLLDGRLHLLVSKTTVIDDYVIVQVDRTLDHRYVIMTRGMAGTTALGVGASREQKVAGKSSAIPVVPIIVITV